MEPKVRAYAGVGRRGSGRGGADPLSARWQFCSRQKTKKNGRTVNLFPLPLRVSSGCRESFSISDFGAVRSVYRYEF